MQREFLAKIDSEIRDYITRILLRMLKSHKHYHKKYKREAVNRQRVL